MNAPWVATTTGLASVWYLLGLKLTTTAGWVLQGDARAMINYHRVVSVPGSSAEVGSRLGIWGLGFALQSAAIVQAYKGIVCIRPPVQNVLRNFDSGWQLLDLWQTTISNLTEAQLATYDWKDDLAHLTSH